MLRSSFERNALCDGYIDYPFDKVYDHLGDTLLGTSASKPLD